MATNSAVTMSNSESEDTIVGIDEAEMALGGISMLLNNGFEEARLLFEKYKYVQIKWI